MNKVRGRIALLICLCLLLVFVLSAIFIAEHAGHDCHGAHCETCATISRLGGTLGRLGAAGAAVITALAAVCRSGIVVLFRASSAGATPISLKVQLNN